MFYKLIEELVTKSEEISKDYSSYYGDNYYGYYM
jgi:hypothetical protein